MKILQSGAKYSAIVGISEKLKALEKETGKPYLMLNRGVNAVVPIDLNPIIRQIDFNSPSIQVYSPNSGRSELRRAINQSYFQGQTDIENILVTIGGMNALDLAIQILDFETLYTPRFYWAAYPNVARLRGKQPHSYQNLEWLHTHAAQLKGQVVILCDPNNPLGSKIPDGEILETVDFLEKNGTIVLYDSPYRRLFFDEEDTLYRQLLAYPNVIISESFSKSVGLSGQRIGFMHTQNKALMQEARIRLLYETNSVNGFSQVLVHKLLTTPEGRQAVGRFKKNTTAAIQKNIRYLRQKGWLAEEFYEGAEPVGIFVVVRMDTEKLLSHRIGSVSLEFFTQDNAVQAEKYARICVSVPHATFTSFMDPIV